MRSGAQGVDSFAVWLNKGSKNHLPEEILVRVVLVVRNDSNGCDGDDTSGKYECWSR